MERKYDFSGWATRNGLLCSDGRTIMKDAFKHCDGQKVPLVWGHQHNDPEDVLGHALLENRDEGVYAYCSFNETKSGEIAKTLVKHGDVTALSIYANQLKQDTSKRVMHGTIREVSLVMAGANPGALIENVILHSADGDFIRELEDECVIYNEENIELFHADANNDSKEDDAKDDKKADDSADNKDGDETIEEVLATLNEKQNVAVQALVAQVIEDLQGDDKNIKHENSEGGNELMHTNVFDQETVKSKKNVLSHADKAAIIALAKEPGVASLQSAIKMYFTNNEELAHVFSEEEGANYDLLFKEPHLLNPGAPEILRDFDNSWVMKVINKIHKSPFARIRTRKADARGAELKAALAAKGYKKGAEKEVMGKIKLLSRSTTPQTVYIKSELHRDDIIDFEGEAGFDMVQYQWGLMKEEYYETIAIAALIGDGREDIDPDKIKEDCIRPIYKDDDFYCIHQDVDIEAAKAALQGTETGAHFGENYIYAEAIITAALYSREKFKGTGVPAFYCTPHLVNVMLLARDLNGRRIYDSKADLAKALNVTEIVEIERLEGVTRTTDDGEKKLLGLFVNLADYTFGAVKGGQLTKFEDFDIDYNKYKYLMEGRLSGSLTEPYSAIALEEPIAG